jgi:alpha-beta hydrolase superfamily lysophospholipase
MIPIRSLFLAAAMAVSPAIISPASAAPVSFDTKDGVKIFGDFRKSEGQSRGTILLFHMAGSNKSEYAPLAPVLNKAGFSTLAIDQRSGGDLWGDVNKTAASAKGSSDFADAIPDLEAAIAFSRAQHSGPIAVWGSSYSSALVFLIAARHPEVQALLAFSPAEYIQGYSIEKEAAKLFIPVFITSAPDGGEIASARTLAEAVPGHRAIQYIPKNGVHGSATLRTDEDPQGAPENWKHVLAFLDGAFPRH